ncbi:histidine phosphatase family protein [Thomasclavelia sp.]
MSLYVTRHGETDYNVENLVCGISEAILTKRGIEQAENLAVKLKMIDYKYLYVSPLQRALDTAKYADKKNLTIMVEPRLKEINFGIYEGVHRKCKEFLVNKNNLAYRYPGGESFIELCKRVYEFLDKIKEEATSNDVLLVCHGAVCRAIHSYFNDMTNEEIFNFQTDNCELLKYEY